MAVSSLYYQCVLVIDPARVFGGGLALLAVSLLADSVVHLAGWMSAERPVHWSLFAGMVIALTGVFLRAGGSGQHRKEPVHADR